MPDPRAPHAPDPTPPPTTAGDAARALALHLDALHALRREEEALRGQLVVQHSCIREELRAIRAALESLNETVLPSTIAYAPEPVPAPATLEPWDQPLRGIRLPPMAGEEGA